MKSRAWATALALTVAVVASAMSIAHPAAAEEARCRIGKPSYCEKYGHQRCETANRLGDEACTKWRAACFRCHEPVSACLGDAPVAVGQPRCRTCSARWSRCMRAIDARHWPNRLSQ